MNGFEFNEDLDRNPENFSKQGSKILLFFEISDNKPPKKEYLRCKLIRGHKRSIRQLLSNRIPKTTIHRFDPSDKNAKAIWHLMNETNMKNPSMFKEISKAESGPKTNGRSKHRADSENTTQKSFNYSFCRVYFRDAFMRESFSLYIDLIFSKFEPETLCEKFEFRCCRSEVHLIECLEKWFLLYQYVKIEMIKDLGLEPNDYYSTCITLPRCLSYVED